MKLITRDTDYAVRALLYIASQKGKVLSVSELVKELRIPKPFLRKILQKLTLARMLCSYKGSGGGFLLRLPAHKIFLSDLMKVFQGGFKLNECMFIGRHCPNAARCYLRKRVCLIEKKVAKELGSISMASLLR